jgi:hypothetical protein
MTTTPTSSMTLQEARSVYWLRNNHRPLGELLDEGFLNERRLRWAAEKAYDPDLKAAAAVLLEHVRHKHSAAHPRAHEETPAQAQPPLELSITEDEARATLWPFPPHKQQPMGELVDSRSLSLKDLGYAIENAWDRRVRDAAILLMAQRLRQVVAEPRDDTGPPSLVSGGSSFSLRRERLWIMVMGAFLAVVIIAFAFALFFSVRMFVRGIRHAMPVTAIVLNPTLIIALAAVLLGLIIGYWIIGKVLGWILETIMHRIESHRQGHGGEQRVLDAVRQNLDGAWTLFSNVELPERRGGDIDMVLVGPSGVWVLEVKNFEGAYRNYGEHWDYRAGKDWKPARKRGPSRQARDNAVRLANFLRADGLRQYVEPAVVWANEATTPEVEQPVVPVWTLDRLSDELGNLQRGRKLDEATQAQIVDKLTALCERQAERDTS